MRKAIAILLLSVFVFSHTELHQLFKIPVLLEHLSEHRKEDPSITFFQFIKLHYEKIVVDDDYQRDQQLPFRDMDCSIVLSLNTDVPSLFALDIQNDFQVVKKEFYKPDNSNYSHQFSNTIFQPPRIA